MGGKPKSNLNLDMDKFAELDKVYKEKLTLYTKKWKWIYVNGKKTTYKVSNKGEVKDMIENRVLKAYNYRIPTGHFNTSYMSVELVINGKNIKFPVHRLVATAFHKIPKRYSKIRLTEKDLVVNHKDGVKNHNAAFNLEWCTYKENIQHAFDTGLCTGIFGENSHLSKMSNSDARVVCELISNGLTNSEVVAATNINGLTEKMVQHIRSRECWRNISKDYVFPKLINVKPYSISDEIVHAICKRLEYNYENNISESDTCIANEFGLRRESVRDIRNRKRRTSISKNYLF